MHHAMNVCLNPPTTALHDICFAEMEVGVETRERKEGGQSRARYTNRQMDREMNELINI